MDTKHPLSVRLLLSFGAETLPHVGTRPRKTAASSATSKHSPLSASRPFPSSTMKPSLTRSGTNCSLDGVLVWVDPIHQGKTRAVLDPRLREIAARGPWVSAHPDVILKMGVKEVLYRTRHLGWAATRIATTAQTPSASNSRRAFEPAARG
jgi:hypothetical protein